MSNIVDWFSVKFDKIDIVDSFTLLLVVQRVVPIDFRLLDTGVDISLGWNDVSSSDWTSLRFSS